MSDFQAHQQLVLRVHEALAEKIREEMTLEGDIPPIELKRERM